MANTQEVPHVNDKPSQLGHVLCFGIPLIGILSCGPVQRVTELYSKGQYMESVALGGFTLAISFTASACIWGLTAPVWYGGINRIDHAEDNVL